uniref:muellerian-inhibiting factor n=1 Tax=Semicossyphus pulcher TaxID=241346 RepID=UPI0037E9AE8E
MLVVDFFYCGALMLCWTKCCVALIPPYNPTMTDTGDGLEIENAQHTSSTMTSSVSHHVPHLRPCFVDDILAALREGVGNSGEISNRTLSLFGVCTDSDNSSGSVLSELAKKASRNLRHGLEVLHLAGGLLAEGDERGALKLTFDLPHSPLLKPNPALLLAFESPITLGNLDVTFTSQSLHPHTQSVCISGETQFIMLAGKESEGKVHHKWRISAETNSPVMNQRLKDLLIGGKSESNISMTPLLLFSGERGSDTRHIHVSGQSMTPSHTSSFLCELRRFLGDVLPQDHTASPPLQLDSLQSLPPLTLGLSSSETLLSGLMNSSALTIFSFSSWGSNFHVQHGELAMSPALLEELRQRLEQNVMQIMAVIREEDEGRRATQRLGRLREHSAFPKKELATGESQYCAFLLLKALQTVARVYEVEKRLRATRAGSNNSMSGTICGLRSLTVSLERYVVGPNTANINNCHGSCTFSLVNANNHAILLSSHNAEERAPCCVPVSYEPLEVVDLYEHGTELSMKQDVVAKKCGCR